MAAADDEQSRAKLIYDHLEYRSFLLMIHNVDAPLDLAAIGLPTPLSADRWRPQKVIFTTRSEAVCAAMCSASASPGKNAVEMRCLGEEDAWGLFAERAGLGTGTGSRMVGGGGAYGEEVERELREVAAACGGVPEALCMVGTAMSMCFKTMKTLPDYGMMSRYCNHLLHGFP